MIFKDFNYKQLILGGTIMEKVLEILKEDARATPKDIAIMLGITEEEVIEKNKSM
jgi:DNA-binding Lrp family transcriptional regulator